MKLSVKLFLLSLIMFAKLSWGGESSGLVTYIYVHTPNILMFQAGTQNAPAGCSKYNQWAISLDDPMGKPLYALLLSAQAQGKPVYIKGYSNTCQAWDDRELPSYGVIDATK